MTMTKNNDCPDLTPINNCNDLCLRHLELKLIIISGYSPEFFECTYCRNKLEPTDHFFSFNDGGIFCGKCKINSNTTLLKISLNCMKIIRLLYREKDINNIQKINLEKNILLEIENFLLSYLKYILEKDIKSYKFIKTISEI